MASPGFTSNSFVPLSRQSSGLHRTTTRPTTTATSVATQDIICAVSESRGISSTVGLAFVNLSTAETALCQICDSQTYVKTVTKIGVFEPTEILFMNTAKESKLFYIIEENVPNTTLTFLDRKFWSDKTCLEYADRLAFPMDIESIKITFGGNYFAACCFAAVIQYVELELNRVFMAQSLRIRFEPSQGSMSIDLPTIFSLELIQNLHLRKSKENLYGLLNETLTPMGARLLRANLLQPSTEESKLLARYDAVEDLSTKEEMFASVRQALKGFVDADKVLTSLVLVPTKQTFQYLEQSVNNVIMLKTCVSSIKPVYKALAPAQSSLLLTIRELCAPVEYRDIEQMIEDTINDHITYQSKPLDLRNQRIYCIKAGVNTLLDVARQTYKEASVDAAELVAKLSETHSVDLDLKFDKARQYYVSFQATELDSLPEIFINVYRKKNRIECQTLDLVKLNQKITDAHNEVVNMSDETVQELIRDVCAGISKMFRASEAIAMLDMLAAFAQLATCNDYIRPELTDTLAIKDGRHPIREKIHAKKFIPNDAYATQQSRFQIITGCNMSGKSTYIRTLALMTVMAQVGCFVPAEHASFRIVHELFARVSTSDDLEANVSTFAAEMREMSFILRNISPRSMVIVDELGRGTSTTDGLCIAIAIAEALIQSKALVWFVTHFQDLATILAQRSGVISLHLAAEILPDASKMTMLYKIAEGPNTSQFYGLTLAKLVDLSSVVLQTARRVSEQLSKISERRHGSSRALNVARKRNLLLSLREQLLQARSGNFKGEMLRKWLQRLQDDFTLRMAAIDEEDDALIEESDGFIAGEDNSDSDFDDDGGSNNHDYSDQEELEMGFISSGQSIALGSPFEYSDDGLPSDSIQVFNDGSTDEMLTFATSSSDGQVLGVEVSSDIFS
ncbi:putative DNA mismatch repair protein Msh4 [Aspergillus steynii IBT 23096]|uniref:Putative DNA mismatch repair protein Msh4 n=1 Tax=Aspergillus steynii IBT 23096 TaxID=1392250 RepID=A0A2I2FXB8_9EURO|nr:putative DNA mismatch repair protein Msh4 [Aspergillus steynii IBT 23096]PLB45281.1 putative DNA mismatch repair protein Msh4 [Aspergillus steynii IBT 23096]